MGFIGYPEPPIEERIQTAIQKGHKAYLAHCAQLENQRRREKRIEYITIFVIVAIIICAIYFISRGCDGTTPPTNPASEWTFQESDIPFGEYGGRVKQFEDSKGAYIRKGAGTNFQVIVFVPSGSWLRIKSFDDKEWGTIREKEDWWLKVYSKDEEIGYIVYEYIDKQLKQE